MSLYRDCQRAALRILMSLSLAAFHQGYGGSSFLGGVGSVGHCFLLLHLDRGAASPTASVIRAVKEEDLMQEFRFLLWRSSAASILDSTSHENLSQFLWNIFYSWSFPLNSVWRSHWVRSGWGSGWFSRNWCQLSSENNDVLIDWGQVDGGILIQSSTAA